MTITLDIPEETLNSLRSEAHAQGRQVESLAAEHLIERYSPDPIFSIEGSEEEMVAIGEALQNVKEGRTHPFDANAILRKYGVSPSRQ